MINDINGLDSGYFPVLEKLFLCIYNYIKMEIKYKI